VLPEAWAQHVLVQADNIQNKMRVAMAASPPLGERQHGIRRPLATYDQASRYAIKDSIEQLLNSARSAAQRRRRSPLQWVLDRWRGTRVERAFQSLHAAEVFLIELLPASDIEALIPSAIASVDASFGPVDPRRQQVDSLRVERDPARRRAGLKNALEIAYTSSDQLHARIRSFRNILLAAAALISIFMIGLVVVVTNSPSSMPLCFHPSVTSGQSATGEDTRSVCPSGQDPITPLPPGRQPRQPEARDVMIVAGLGLLGGALGAAFAIRKLRGSSTPYDVPTALALLKVPSGALTAVAGVLLLGGGFVPGLSELDSQRQILAYALVFGYAQQLATRFIDDRAQSILQSVPSKDAEIQHPKAPTPLIVDGTTQQPSVGSRRRLRRPRSKLSR